MSTSLSATPLLRHSWLIILIIGVCSATAIYQRHQFLHQQLFNSEISVLSQNSAESIRSALQQKLEATQSMVAFLSDELQDHAQLSDIQTYAFIQHILDTHRQNLDAVTLLSSAETTKPITHRQADIHTATTIPVAGLLSKINTNASHWSIEQLADHTWLRIIIGQQLNSQRIYVISDWNIKSFIEQIEKNASKLKLYVTLDMISGDNSQRLFSNWTDRAENSANKHKYPDTVSHHTFSFSATKFVINTQPTAKLIDELSDSNAIWIFLMGLCLTVLLSRYAFRHSRIAQYLEAEISEKTQALSEEREKLAAVIDHSHDSILITDKQGRIIRANPAAIALFQYSEEELYQRTIQTLLPAEIQQPSGNWFTQHLTNTTNTGQVENLLATGADNIHFPCETTVHPFLSGNDQRVSIVLRDITEHNRREWVQMTLLDLRAISQASSPLHTRLKQILEAMLSDPWSTSMQAGAIYIRRDNQQWLSASFGWSVAEKRQWITLPKGQSICGKIKELPTCSPPHSSTIFYQSETHLFIQMISHAKSLGHLCIKLKNDHGINDHYLHFCEQAREIITELLLREQVRLTLAESENKHRQLVDNTPLAIVIYSGGMIRYINPAGVFMFGATSAADIISHPVMDFIVQQGESHIVSLLHVLQQGGHADPSEEQFRNLKGDTFWGELRGVATEYENGPAVQLLIEDITSRKEAQIQLELLSYSDDLTGLPNRRLYTDRLDQACSMARRSERPLCLLFLDLNRFKVINDTRGHACGDAVLKVVSERLLKALRTSDTAARMGGDEFAILLPDTEPEKALGVAAKLVAALKHPIILGDQSITIGASIGLAALPTDGDDGDTLLKHADSAMYHAKQNHMDVHCFSSSMENIAMRRMQLENHLATAIERGELSLHYQAQYTVYADSTDKTITGLESLMRWNHPEMGMVSPAEFIPLAEEIGMIRSLTTWAVSEVARQALIWEKEGVRPPRISVNISAAQLMQHDLAVEILDLIKANGAKPEWLKIEVTETAAMSQPETAIAIMRTFVDGGVSIAIDDFGTGYSSLAYLKRLPADLLKIDIAFVRNLPEDAEDAVIVRTIIAMAHALGLKVIAEGVETKAQLDFLRHEECDQIQGYLLGRPLPIVAISKVLHSLSC
ncbi:MAG: EAL domain-containing protein [Mariprofundus sp.]|nr:EAL domain-containing protein [Mariprofundus sp.]